MLVKEKAEKDTGLGNRSDETERGKKNCITKIPLSNRKVCKYLTYFGAGENRREQGGWDNEQGTGEGGCRQRRGEGV